MIKRLARLLLLIIPLIGFTSLSAQTPGLIIKPAIGAGSAILDPDRDGYVSQKTNGVQLGFTNPPDNDVLQSELPYVPLIKPDPLADLLRGPTGSFSEIVGIDAAGNNAILAYNDGANLLIRFRLGGYAPNSKSYSLLIDTDGKFGFTGINADPNAVPGNPGFEAEIVLETNFFIKAYNINGLTTGEQVASFFFDNNCQKSLAISTASGDADYFYDFYLPFSSITSLFTGSTLLRIVAITVMNPHAAMGNNSLSDVGGADTGMNTDAIFEQLIDAQTPTVPGAEVLDRSDCPSINAVNTASTAISGTSTEPSGTRIDVYVYASNGTTQLGTTFTTVASGTWSVTTPVTLVAGNLVKATATAYGEGASFKNCDIETVTAVCVSPPAAPSITGDTKGICGTIISGATLNVYKNGVLIYSTATTVVGKLQITGTSFMYKPNGSFQNCNSGTNAMPDGLYEISQTVAGCESAKSSYSLTCSGTSAKPIVTGPVYAGTVTISGTSTASASIELFINDVSAGAAITATAGGTWSFASKTVSAGQTVKVVANESGKCTAGISDVVTVTTLPAVVIVGTYCGTVTSISGYSDATSGTVQIFVSPAVAQGSAVTIQSNGNWTCTGLSIAPGTIIYAKATISGGVTVNSSNMTTGTKTTSATAITTATIYEGDASITGTGTNLDVITLYVDGSAPYQTNGTSLYTATVSGGTWTIGGISAFEFYIGAAVTVTAKSGTNCESDASASKIVQCVLPTNPTYTAGNYGYCYNSAGSVGLTTSQAGVVYQLVNSSGVAVGPASIGTGSGITLYTNALIADLLNVVVKVYKIGYSSCTFTSTDKINFTPVSASPNVTATSTSLSVEYGTTTVNLPYSAKSATPLADRYTIDYSVAAANQGFIDVVTPTAISSESGNIVLTVPYDAAHNKPALGTYAGTLIVSASSGSSCSSSYNFTITVYSGSAPPVISSHPTNVTICSGSNTVLSVTASAATSYQWQTASTITGTYTNVSGGSGGTSASYTTPNLTSTTYYKVIVTNASGSVTSNIATVTVTPIPSASGAITGSATVCAGQTSVAYGVASISNATSYTWTYGGSNVTINGSTNSVSLSFASTATSGTLTAKGTNNCGSGTAATLSITVNPAPFINNMTASSCSGASFTVTPTDGVNGIVPGSATYSWSAPTVTSGLTGGALGTNAANISGTLTNSTGTTQTATYTVIPKNGTCTGASFTVIVSVYPPISPVATPAATICNSGSTGSISLSVSGGTPGYTYLWTGGATTQNLGSQAPGTYTVTVTDSKGCSNSTSGTVTQTAAITITPSVTAVTCNGGANGAITLTSVSGGNGGYTYLWNDGSSSMNRTGLASGTYTVTVTDSKGCTQSSSGLSVGQPAALNISTDVQTNVGCYGGTNGAISITASGGTGAYTYLWSDGSTSEDRTGLAKGTYSVTITDIPNGCTATESFTITQPSKLLLSTVLTRETCPGSLNGAINLTVSGGTPYGSAPLYRYAWTASGNGAVPVGQETGEDLTLLKAGTYAVVVTDALGCPANASLTITAVNPSPVKPGTIGK